MDRLSQLQTCLDQLVTQVFSSVNYINRHHDFVPIGNQPKVEDEYQEAAPAAEFDASLTELAQDMVAKAKQIEVLIDSLPELEAVQQNQETGLRDLENELAAARRDEDAVALERRELRRQCDDLIMQISKDKAMIEMGL